MDPGAVPDCLEGMTEIEEMLIARVCPIMTVYHKHGGQRGYSGHVLNLPQKIQHFLNKLPTTIRNLPVLIISREGVDNTKINLHARQKKVLHALQWLQANNKYYADIEIDYEIISTLPVYGVPNDLLHVQDNSDDDVAFANEGLQMEDLPFNDDSLHPSTSFLPQTEHTLSEEDAIRSTISGNDPLEWPPIEQNATNEFRTNGLASMAFPTLFPYGKGDPTCMSQHHKVSLADTFKHLLRFTDFSPDGHYRWRFASHSRFPYRALNMKHRHQLLSQSKVFIKYNPSDAM